MSNPPYSVPMFRNIAFSGTHQLLYRVPPNKRAILKSITVCWGSIVLSGLDVWLEDDAGCKIYRLTFTLSQLPATAEGGYDLAFGSWVFLDGEGIFGGTNVGTVDLQGSGYELVMPSV